MCMINNELTMVIIPIRDIEEKEREEGTEKASHLHLKYFMSLVKRNRADEDLQ